MGGKFRVLGIDPSTKSGMTILDIDRGKATLVTARKVKTNLKGMERLGFILDDLNQVLDEYSPDHVAIEGYSFHSKFSLVTMAEVGTIYRYGMWQRGVQYDEIPPTSLKKFVGGKGNAKKELMLLEVYAKWGYKTDDNDLADAFGLAMLAAHKICGLVSDDMKWAKKRSLKFCT